MWSLNDIWVLRSNIRQSRIPPRFKRISRRGRSFWAILWTRSFPFLFPLMTPSLEGLKTEEAIGSVKFSELEKFFEFQRLIIPASPRCGQPLIFLVPLARLSPSMQWNDVFRLWMTM
jgi:hypothetical protein